MIRAFLKAFAQLSDPAMRRFVWIGLAAAAAVFAALWAVVWQLLANMLPLGSWWIEWAVDLFGGILTLALTWMFFPGIAIIVVGFMLEGVAAAVEARHYPHLGAARHPSVMATTLGTVRFLAVMIVLNLVALIFLLMPPLFPFVFYAVNGYLLGREYFDMVALRRAGDAAAKSLRRARRGHITLAGVAIAMLMTVPVVNLLTPVVATAAMVHLFEAWRERPGKDLTEG